jgi:hypothetical protein
MPRPVGPRARALTPDAPPLSDDVIVAWWRAQCERQGLPEKITEPATLARLITLALGPPEAGERHD